MTSAIYALNSNDFVKSAINAVVVAVIIALGSVATQAGFDVFTADWGAIFHNIINVAIATFMADVSRRFVTDKDGKLFGKIG